MEKRTIGILCVVFLILINVYPQKQMLDVVYLKNGSIIKGEILEINRDKELIILTTDNKKWIFHINEIDYVKHEKGTPSGSLVNQLTKGYINFSGMGLLIGDKSNEQIAPFSVSMVNGYAINQHVSIGGGVGLEFLEITSVPIFADTRYYIGQNRANPFVSLQGGYSFPIEDKSSNYYQQMNNVGGYLINPGLGLLVHFYSGEALFVHLGYRHQKVKYTYNDEFDREMDHYYNRLNIRVGLMFR